LTRVRLENITKVYGRVVAVDHISFTVESGELFTLLGPSGCGKTTTLRIIAGFEVPEEGSVYFDNEDVTFLKPYHRDTAMVFQNYALWPHMTVYDNVAYVLRIRKKKMHLSEEDIRRKVKWALDLVKLTGLENRFPLQLSGGQQQRVALARALVVEPRVLLLDEPLSNLDAKLRIEMRGEIKMLQRKLGITTIYVTHDQVEAMSISDKIAIINKGRLLQYGTPRDVYFHPRKLFVADFIGRSNIYEGEVIGSDGEFIIVNIPLLNATIKAIPVSEDVKGKKKVSIIIRPEIAIPVSQHEKGDNILHGIIKLAMFLGEKVEIRVGIGKGEMIVYLPNYYTPAPQEEITFRIPATHVIAIPETK
jgi:ABC-type Fe3+/spermidine/putrescine transport system ATPase subunit